MSTNTMQSYRLENRDKETPGGFQKERGMASDRVLLFQIQGHILIRLPWKQLASGMLFLEGDVGEYNLR